MRAEYINPFLTSTASVFSQMLGVTVRRQPPFVGNAYAPPHDVTGIVGLTGKATGTVAVSLPGEMALSVTSALIGECPTSITPQVADAVGELTNMIAGAAKAQLESLNLNLGLPTVIVGRSTCISFPSSTCPISIPFDSPLGSFTVQVGLVEQPQEAALR